MIKIVKNVGGYPNTLECDVCGFRWFKPVSGNDCPKCYPRLIGPACSENGILGFTNEEIETMQPE